MRTRTKYEASHYAISNLLSATLTLSGSNIFLSTQVSNTLSVCSALSMRDQDSHPHSTAAKIPFLVFFFNILLTVHLNIFISKYQPTWCTKFYNKFISSLYMFRAYLLIVRRAKLYYTVSGITQFCPPDDEHMCSKHVEAWNKLIIKFSASSPFLFILIFRQNIVESAVARFPEIESSPNSFTFVIPLYLIRFQIFGFPTISKDLLPSRILTFSAEFCSWDVCMYLAFRALLCRATSLLVPGAQCSLCIFHCPRNVHLFDQ